MKTVLILRHAKSSWSDPLLPDHDRPLNKRGQRTATQMGQLLRKQKLVPELILTSTAKRARETAILIAQSSQYNREIKRTSQLYLATPQVYISKLSDLSDEYQRVMVIGHNPGLELLINELTGCHKTMSTAALAQVCLSIDNWPQILCLNDRSRGQLVQLWQPKELPTQ